MRKAWAGLPSGADIPARDIVVTLADMGQLNARVVD
jgi:hypothetical protein